MEQDYESQLNHLKMGKVTAFLGLGKDFMGRNIRKQQEYGDLFRPHQAKYLVNVSYRQKVSRRLVEEPY